MENRLQSRRYSRRQVLKTAAGGAGLAAAAFAAPTFLRGTSLAASTSLRLAIAPSSPTETSLVKQLVSDFMKANPDISVSVEPITSDYVTKLETDLAAGTGADAFYVDSLPAPDLMSTGLLHPIDDFMQKSGVKASDFYAEMISAFEWEGKTYGIPKDWSGLATVYDPAAFKAAEITKPPANWDEVTSVAEKLKAKSGKAPIVLDPDFARFIAFLYEGGGSVLNNDKTAVVLDSPQAVKALEFYEGLYKQGIAKTSAEVGAQWPGDALAKGLASLVFEGNWLFPFLQTNSPKLYNDVGIAVMPEGPTGDKATMAFTVCYAMNAKTKNPDQTWTLINYMTGPTGMKTWTDLGLAMPTRPALADAWEKKYPNRAPYLEMGSYAKPWTFGPGGQKFYNDVNAILQAVVAGTTTPQAAIPQMTTKAKADLKLATK